MLVIREDSLVSRGDITPLTSYIGKSILSESSFVPFPYRLCLVPILALSHSHTGFVSFPGHTLIKAN